MNKRLACTNSIPKECSASIGRSNVGDTIEEAVSTSDLILSYLQDSAYQG
jgi:hypothetical protein